jgi:hypothetical protein
MARQRMDRVGAPAGGMVAPDAVDQVNALLDREALRTPGEFRSGLERIDPFSRAGALQRLQAGVGNGAIGGMLAGPARAAQARQAAPVAASVMLQREDGDEGGDSAQPLDTKAAAGAGATETIGPPTSADYSVTASSLEDVLDAISARDEAGHVGWVESMTSTANTGPTVDTANVTVTISLEMPSWTPPATMLPKAKAEWTRWYGALLAHEQGHIKLVHDVHDGLAKRLLGQTPTKAQQMFNAAKASLTTKSNTYDTTTSHGLKTGTVLNVGIEQAELAEEQKKKDEAAKAKAKSHEAAVPDVPEDE